MNFFKKYGILAIFLLGVYGLFILGSLRGFIGITGNVIELFGKDKNLLIYGGIGLGGLILLLGFLWIVIKILKKKGKKKNGEVLEEKTNLLEEKIKPEHGVRVDHSEEKKINNEKINKLLLQGGKFLVDEDMKNAEKIYFQIKNTYSFEQDKDKKVYRRIINYYNDLLNLS